MDIKNLLPKDAIPSIDDPSFGDEYDGPPDDDLIVLATDPPRAYPVRYLHYHEIVNDVLPPGFNGDTAPPVAVTWCPLCGSAVVYDRRVNGRTLAFGVSGKLADDDLVMFDRETNSEWKQSLGRAINGPLEGETLTVLPMSMCSWETFAQQSPSGIVLQPPGGSSEVASDTDEPVPIEYDLEPYDRYFERDGFGLAAHRRGESNRAWERDDLDPKTVVLGIETTEAVGFPYPWIVDSGGVVTASVGGVDVIVFATTEGIDAFENPGYSFVPTSAGTFHGDGTTWTGATGESVDGRSLRRIPARRMFAFAWQDDHGPNSFYEQESV